jgi:hypothetical protein
MLLLANEPTNTSGMSERRKFSDDVLTLLHHGKGLRIRAGTGRPLVAIVQQNRPLLSTPAEAS